MHIDLCVGLMSIQLHPALLACSLIICCLSNGASLVTNHSACTFTLAGNISAYSIINTPRHEKLALKFGKPSTANEFKSIQCGEEHWEIEPELQKREHHWQWLISTLDAHIK